MFEQVLLANTTKTRITERSVFSTFHLFCVDQHRRGLLTDTNFHILKQQYEIYLKFHTPALFVYLRVEPEVVFRRLRMLADYGLGGNEGAVIPSLVYNQHYDYESLLNPDYLAVSNSIHYISFPDDKHTTPVLMLDAGLPEEEIVRQYRNLLACV
jgi:hypothetical protein